MLKVNGYDAMKEGNDLLRQELQSSHKQQQALSERLELVSIENDDLRKKVSEQVGILILILNLTFYRSQFVEKIFWSLGFFKKSEFFLP